MNKRSSKGISLISLIITIIVIIILAAIVIFSGMGTPEKAQLSAVVSDIDNVQTAVYQAYYGLYTEKSVEGEVWTKGQLYESIATGESNREDLSGVGIVEISEAGMVKMSLPKYEGRSWGVAVENIDETVQTGSVVLYPGFETAGKVYSTLLDTQTGGRDSQLEETINANIKVKNLRITTDSSGTTLAGEKIDEGTKLYISFDVSQNASTVTVTPSIPYEVTENGSYIFTLTNVEGKTKKYKVNVDNYLAPTLPNLVKMGDYIEYTPDTNSYTTRPEYTGYMAQNLSTQSTNWRVIYVDEDTGKVYIVSDKGVNTNLTMQGMKIYFSGDEELDNICKKLYSNKELGLTARSSSRLDINKVADAKVAENATVSRYAYYPKGTVLNGENTIEYLYNKKVLKGASTRFYIGEGDMFVQIDENGLEYRVPEKDRPVYVEHIRNLVEYYKKTENYQKYVQITGASNIWYTNSQMFLYDDGLKFTKTVYYEYKTWTEGDKNYISIGFCWYPIYKTDNNNVNVRCNFQLRPVIEIDSTFRVDKIDNPDRDGSTSTKAWKIVKNSDI